MGRRRTSYPIRCWRMVGVTVLLVLAACAFTAAPHIAAWIITGRWDG